jgi:hypothetical protein
VIRTGDSIVAKINEGLGECTHFVVLLTPVSLTKPWVQAEMDAGFVRRVEGTSRFFPVRVGLAVSDLPPLIQPLYAPSLDDYDPCLEQLINDLFGLTIAPPLGDVPERLRPALPPSAGLSPAAGKIAQLLVLRSEHARFHDPCLPVAEVMAITGLTEDDVGDAVNELQEQGLASTLDSLGHRLGYHAICCSATLFIALDPFLMGWSPEDDARRVAAALVASASGQLNVRDFATSVGWVPRRMNPAIHYLELNQLIDRDHSVSPDYEASHLIRTPRTRRYVRAE